MKWCYIIGMKKVAIILQYNCVKLLNVGFIRNPSVIEIVLNEAILSQELQNVRSKIRVKFYYQTEFSEQKRIFVCSFSKIYLQQPSYGRKL